MRLMRSSVALTVAALAACGGDSGTAPPPPPPAQQTLATISLPSNSLALNAGQSTTLTPQAFDAAGAAIAGVTGFTFTTSEPTVAEISGGGGVLAIGAGTSVVTVSLTRDGITATTTANVVVTGALPASATVVAGNASNTFTPASLVVAVAADVTFSFGTRVHNVTHGSTAGAPTDIPNTSNANVVQSFPTAGDFVYDCTLHPGMQGTVIVR